MGILCRFLLENYSLAEKKDWILHGWTFLTRSFLVERWMMMIS